MLWRWIKHFFFIGASKKNVWNHSFPEISLNSVYFHVLAISFALWTVRNVFKNQVVWEQILDLFFLGGGVRIKLGALNFGDFPPLFLPIIPLFTIFLPTKNQLFALLSPENAPLISNHNMHFNKNCYKSRGRCIFSSVSIVVNIFPFLKYCRLIWHGTLPTVGIVMMSW